MAQYFDPRRIPMIGEDIYQVGQVYRIISQPCAPDPWIAFLAFWAYTPQLLWSLFMPDYGDITFDRGGRRHKRVRRPRFLIDGSMLAPKPKQGGLAWAMFTGYQIAERVGWYMVVADATTDFAVNWTSMAYGWSGCQVGNQPTSWFRSDGHRVGILNPGSWVTTSGTDYDFAFPTQASDGAVGLGQDLPHTVRATVVGHTEPWLGMSGGMTGARLVRNRGGGRVDYIPLTQSWDAEGKQSYTGADAIYHQLHAGWQYQLQTQWGGGIAHIDHLRVELTAAPSTNPTPLF